MKVLLVNGSPEKNGCINASLEIIGQTLNENGIDFEIFWLGTDPIRDCINCKACVKMKANKCVFDDDCVNRLNEKAEECDGFVFGSPVYYAHANGRILSVLDRAFYSGNRLYQYKPCAVVSSARRAGTTCAIDDLLKYPTISNMPVVSSQYWPMVHGYTKEDVLKDEEGCQTLRVLARNMAWMLKCFKLGKENGIDIPEKEKRVFTNFI